MVKRAPRASDWCGLSELRNDVERVLLRRCRDRGELDDLVQETLLRAASFRDGLEEPERLRAWVLRIAWNVLRDHVRRERRLDCTQVSEEALIQLADPGVGCDPADGAAVAEELRLGAHVYDGEEVFHTLCGLLPELDSADRQLFEVYYREDLGCGEAARRLGVSTQTVKMRLFRLRRRLRRSLQKRSALQLTPRFAAGEAVA